jgi:hypothetical protein
VISKVVVREAETVPRCGFTFAMTEFVIQGKRLLAILYGLPVTAQPHRTPAKRAECVCAVALVPDILLNVESLLCV